MELHEGGESKRAITLRTSRGRSVCHSLKEKEAGEMRSGAGIDAAALAAAVSHRSRLLNPDGDIKSSSQHSYTIKRSQLLTSSSLLEFCLINAEVCF